jgi:hypothetical protein
LKRLNVNPLRTKTAKTAGLRRETVGFLTGAEPMY